MTPKKGEELPAVVTYRMTRVPFGVTSSPFLLAATLQHHLEGLPERYAETAGILRKHHYVDNLVTGVDSLDKGKVLCQESNDILSQAGMRLHKWMSNDRDLVNFLENGNVERRNADAEHAAATKVLGVGWNAQTDPFEYNLTSLIDFLSARADNKRFVLQVSARIFDPFGFISPTTLCVKVMFQKLWELGIGWDDPLPETLQPEWDCWCRELPCIEGVSIPRLIAADFGNDDTEKVVHLFCDASPKAYGAVAYIVTKSPFGLTNVSLVMAKSRVAPLKRLSLPRLELMGALIGARLCHYVAKALDLKNVATILWTDSTVAMYWIKGNAARWKPFVANEVSELQALTDPSDWRHCPGSDNPADLITRGILPSALRESELWWKGPRWLQEDDTCWPTISEPSSKVGECQMEERKGTVMPIVSPSSMTIFNVENYSSFSRVVRVTAWVRRFVDNCHNKKGRTIGPLRAEEVISAERYWLAKAQEDAFSDGISNLKNQRPLHKSSPVLPFNPYLDKEGLMRVGGRLQFSDNNEETKHPIVLPVLFPNLLPSEYLVTNAMDQFVFKATEDFDYLCTGLGPRRAFEMSRHDSRNAELLRLDRPLRLLDSEKNAILLIKGPCCTRPICCENVEFDIVTMDGVTKIGGITKLWGGLYNEACSVRDSFAVTFLFDLDVEMKAVLLGARLSTCIRDVM
ncbi:uncharacterized protein [Dermacentor andersoni]|uniref:uncharacterized protein n=1 Tax=Dermacentor andersoni TaxID=34620 RepID=UPI002416BD5E|nr:uncharacterized protein LOC126518218 [Dermacentor andersoni]